MIVQKLGEDSGEKVESSEIKYKTGKTGFGEAQRHISWLVGFMGSLQL